MAKEKGSKFIHSGYLFVLGAVSIWGVSTGILVKLISIPAFALYAIGAFWGIVFLLSSLALKNKLSDLLRYSTKTLRLMLGVGLGIAVNNGLFFTAIKSGTVANAVLTHYLAPIFVVLIFGPLILKEKITIKNFVLAILGFVVFLFLISPDIEKNKKKSRTKPRIAKTKFLMEIF